MPSQTPSSTNTSHLWHQLWQLISWLEEMTEKPKYKVWRRYLRKYTRPAWLMLGTLGLVLLSVNARLVLASGVGVGSALMVFYLAQKQWFLPPFWQALVEKLHRSRGLAIAAGTTATLSTYAALNLNQPFVDPAMAVGLTLEGGLLLGLLLWLSIRPDPQQNGDTVVVDPLEHYLNQLTDPHPLKRLLALRQVIRLAHSADLSADVRADLADCLRLMLAHETDPTVQQALARHLNSLIPAPQLGEGAAPLHPPIALHQPEMRLEKSEIQVTR